METTEQDHDSIDWELIELYEVLEFTGKIVPPETPRALGAGAGAGPAGFVSRGQCRLRAPRSVTRIGSSVEGNTLHWEGPKMGLWPHESCPTKVRGIQAFHMDVRKWADVAYSSITCPHDHIFEGRWLGARTAANGTNDGNSRSYAHCYLGGAGDPFDMPAKRAVRRVFEHFEANGSGRRRWAHRDWRSTQCPGDAQTEWLRAGMPLSAPPAPGPPPLAPKRTVVFPVEVAVVEKGRVYEPKHLARAQGLMVQFFGQEDLDVDGMWGPATFGAIQNVQRFFGLPVTGWLDEGTWRLLLGAPL